MKRGRKPTDESQARAIRTRLLIWRQIPEAQRPSLRALAEELGTTHQLLSFYLRNLDRWQNQERSREYHRKMAELGNRVQAENRLMSPAEQAQMAAYGRAALLASLDSALDGVVESMEADFKAGKLHRKQVQMLNLMARKRFPPAQKLLASLRPLLR